MVFGNDAGNVAVKGSDTEVEALSQRDKKMVNKTRQNESICILFKRASYSDIHRRLIQKHQINATKKTQNIRYSLSTVCLHAFVFSYNLDRF